MILFCFLIVVDGMEVVFSLLALLIIASFVHVLARKIQVPYTIFLFIVGIFLSPLFSFL